MVITVNIYCIYNSACNVHCFLLGVGLDSTRCVNITKASINAASENDA